VLARRLRAAGLLDTQVRRLALIAAAGWAVALLIACAWWLSQR
jgi:hypothetical protein